MIRTIPPPKGCIIELFDDTAVEINSDESIYALEEDCLDDMNPYRYSKRSRDH